MLGLLALTAAPAAAQQVPPASPTTYQRAIAAGYKAAMYCSGIFTAGRTPAQINADELTGIYPEYDAIVPTLAAGIDRETGTVTVAFDPALPPRRATWTAATGCTNFPIGSPPPPAMPQVAPQSAPADPRPWPIGDAGIAPRPVPALDAAVSRAFAGGYGGNAKTTGIVILRDGAVVAERYAAGWGPFVANRTWSVAKSITGTLVGIAVGEGLLDPDRQPNIPEWRAGGDYDPRNAIRLDHLLRMASGLHGDTAGNRTDAVYFGGTAVTEQLTALPLDAAPATRFRYANADILLVVRSLRATLGEARYAGFPRDALFAPVGMAHTIAETDWRGNYVLSSQVWSTARDLARLGLLWSQDGVWQGRRILPERWVAYMRKPALPQPPEGPGYGRTLWLFGPAQSLPANSYAAQGNRGQYVMVIPSAKLVIVRRGEDPGAARFDIAKFSADVLAATR